MVGQGTCQRFKKLFLDYSQWCTVACLNKVASKVRWLAAVYTILFVVMLALFLYISIVLILKYFKFPSSTELTLDVQSEAFPRFSFCNENPLKRSVVDTDSAFAEISKMLKQFEELEQGSRTTDDFGIGAGAQQSLRMRTRAKMMLRLLMNKLSSAELIRGGYSYTELVTECTFMGKTCSSLDFTSFLHPDYGVCYTFAIERNITRAGAEQALRMLMTVNQDTPKFNVFDFLPTTDSAAIRAVIHQPDDYPDFMMNGFKIGASTQAYIYILKLGHSRTDKPYGNCTTEASDADNYYANFTYTFNTCQHSCLQRVALEKCKCVDPLYKKAADQTYCSTPADMLCLVGLVKQDISTPNGTARVCNCFPACTETRIARTITYGVYPSAKVRVTLVNTRSRPARRSVLLDTQGGGRDGTPNEDADDYDNPPTTTTTTTPSPICVPQDFMPFNDRKNVLGLDAAKCSTDHPAYFDRTKFIVIQGWPCLSNKTCKTCLMYAKPMADWEWPCEYSKFEQCEQYNHNSTSPYDCQKFFGLFDFIPYGVDTPNVTNWAKGWGPGGSVCTAFPLGSQARAACFVKNDCVRIESPSDISQSITKSGLLDPTFLARAFTNPYITKCQFLDKLKTAQLAHYYPTTTIPVTSSTMTSFTGGIKRIKRGATAVDPANSTTAANSTVDKPGYGSCEYANKNFKGAAECIKWYKRNGLTFELYFGSLATNTYTQGPTYTLSRLWKSARSS